MKLNILFLITVFCVTNVNTLKPEECTKDQKPGSTCYTKKANRSVKGQWRQTSAGCKCVA